MPRDPAKQQGKHPVVAPLQLTFVADLPESFYMDIIEMSRTAIVYWAAGHNEQPPYLHEAEYKIIEQDISSGNRRKTFEITVDKVRLGLQRAIMGDKIAPHHRTSILTAVIDKDLANCDDWDIDCVIQLAMFGELVYG
jgi:hypothetical protein